MIFRQGHIPDNFKLPQSFKLISLVPSLSWYLYDLDLHKHISGVTKFCDSADGDHIHVPVVGGTKNPRIEIIHQIRPDLIIANKEENRKEDIEMLSSQFPVYLTEVGNLKEMYQMMQELGALCDRIRSADSFIRLINSGMKELYTHTGSEKSRKVCYLIWKDPLMTIGTGTFIHEMIESFGFENLYSNLTRYPEITRADLYTKNPDIVFLSSEPYPFTEKNLTDFLNLNCLLVDGRMFSWYGSFIFKSIDYLKALNLRITNIL